MLDLRILSGADSSGGANDTEASRRRAEIPEIARVLADRQASFADAVLQRGTVLEVAARDVVYRLGQPADGLYGVVSGSLAFSVAPNERGPHTVLLFRPGFWFGEAEIFDRREKIETITATRDSSPLYVSRASIVELATHDPDIWRQIGHLSALHLELAIGMFDDSVRRRAESRMAAILLWLGGARYCENTVEPEPEIDITQADLARLVVLVRSSVIEHLDRLEGLCLLQRSYGCVKLPDVAGLRALVR